MKKSLVTDPRNESVDTVKVWKTVSVWHNPYGMDEMKYKEENVAFDSAFLERVGEKITWMEGEPLDCYVKEEMGEKGDWIMYSNDDGIGVLCSDISEVEAHKEYDEYTL